MYISLELFNRYIDWTKLKVSLNISKQNLFPRKKEIWWINLGQNIGVEANGKSDRFERPILVIKAFNIHSFLVAPISSKIKQGEYIFEFTNNFGERNVVNLSQLRTVSAKRFIRKINLLPDQDFELIIDRIIDFLPKTKTPLGVFSELPKGEPNVGKV